MGVQAGDPNDGDSALFLQHFRDPENQGLLDTARENLAACVGAIVVGPLSREIRGPRLFDRERLRVGADVPVSGVRVRTSEAAARERIERRGNPGDAYRLQHWGDYRQRCFEPAGAQCDGRLKFDGTAPGNAGFDALVRAIVDAAR